jgi:hypothetical protein
MKRSQIMILQRRTLLSTVVALPALALLNKARAKPNSLPIDQGKRLVLSSFLDDQNYVVPGGGWRGFSDRVMGGISDASLDNSNIAGKSCIRLTGNVTRESNGGFIQMALYFGRQYDEFDAAEYRGIELLVYGNNEDYNVHVRTSDCGWHDESYRMTFFAKPEWQRIQIPWEAFQASVVSEPLDSSRLQRIAILGWMREFKADVSLAEIALYG